MKCGWERGSSEKAGSSLYIGRRGGCLLGESLVVAVDAEVVIGRAGWRLRWRTWKEGCSTLAPVVDCLSLRFGLRPKEGRKPKIRSSWT